MKKKQTLSQGEVEDVLSIPWQYVVVDYFLNSFWTWIVAELQILFCEAIMFGCVMLDALL